MTTLLPLSKPIKATIDIPGCLSYTTRSLILASLTQKEVKIFNYLDCEDVKAMVGCLSKIGIKIEKKANYLLVKNCVQNLTQAKQIPELNVNLSGRTARSILPLLCLVPGEQVLTGSESFLKRPIAEQVDGLRQMGAKIEYLKEDGKLPVKVSSSSLNPGIVTMKGDISAQFFAGIMMIAPLVGHVVLQVKGKQVSKSYIDITTDIMQKFGIKVLNFNYEKYEIPPNQNYSLGEYIVEGDYSSACYFGAISVLTGSEFILKNLNSQSVQGDKLIFDLFQEMGNQVVYNSSGLLIKGERLVNFEMDMEKCIDQAPTLAVLAAFAEGQSVLKNIEILKYKESNRLLAVQNELQKMSINTETDGFNLTIFGGFPVGSEIETYNDHRIAMSFAAAGSKIFGMKIKNPEVVNKSFPKFWQVLKSFGM